MDELVKSLQLGESVTPVLTVWSVIIGCLLAAALSVGVGILYRKVQTEATYSQSLVHTFVLLSMITALIMMVVGSNIARAFSLVGALSIIRFRTAIKSPQDIGFLFWTISMGMACGTRLYSVAIVGTTVMAAIVYVLHSVNFASYPSRQEYLLSVVFYLDVDYENALMPLLDKYFSAYSMSYVESVRQGTLREVVYSVRPKADVKDKEILDEVAKINQNLKVSFRKIYHAIEVP